MGARIDLARVPVLPVFKWLASEGGIAQNEMLRTFNCGIGMIVIASPKDAAAVAQAFTRRRRDRRSASARWCAQRASRASSMTANSILR